MIHASLFSGIGGFDLAAHWMGWQNAFAVEIDPWCRKLLAQNLGRLADGHPTPYPKPLIHDDIKTFDALSWRGRIDILTGGFPCQPFSAAGKRGGTEDDRYLWPEMLRVVREAQPTWVVGENVAGLLTMQGGLVFDQVLADLESEGYEVLQMVIPACAVGAPHRRDRVWIVAHANRAGRSNSDVSGGGKINGFGLSEAGILGDSGPAAHANGSGCEKQHAATESNGVGLASWCADTRWARWPSQPPICGGDDGVPCGVDRAKRIKGLGNAIVPQVAFELFQAIADTQMELHDSA